MPKFQKSLFLSWIHKSYPSKTKIAQYLLFTVLCYLFPKQDKIWLPFYRFLIFRKKKHKKRKTKFDFRFIVFPFMYKQTPKTEERKKTSVLPFFLLCTRKHKNGKTTIGFRFIVFPFMYEKTQKRKNKNGLPFYLSSFFVRTNTWKQKNDKWLPFYRFSLYVRKHKNLQTEIDFRSIVFRFKYNQSVKERPGYNLIFRLYFFLRFSVAV